MLILNTKIDHAAQIDGELVLPFDLREKSRLRATLTNGQEVGVFTVRGTVLRHGDLMAGVDDDGSAAVIKIIAADEATYRVECTSPFALLRCAFHLGNRHTQAQVGDGFLRIRKDVVLREMLEGLGATVTEQLAAFEPESGAYGGGHHHNDGLLAPVPLRQKIHRPGDKPEPTN
ncbi:urease accessory protein UreE [Glaciimonas immobilis]|uniref:Urease accessory protein UreE n=1 Tax=Glaciimonas immobilis TaxID=728004 RepID=A0A840RNG5_9BURK|nr:urease accessory protein UreE [Glaciimonas immobilis]KAF3999101.1 urease accessory protein UreE [Glaciimonas immobilis]MBB5198536.1 urease accessory protein [Glaciimonas immobilis]